MNINQSLCLHFLHWCVFIQNYDVLTK